jgi:multimeric flavodoxin WrbA/RimJ/RimL family protein N-acetyltransferase
MSAFHFEPLTSHHLPLLHKWMQEPHVVEWWGEGTSWSFEEIEKKYSSYIHGYKTVKEERKPIYPFLMYFQGNPIGYIQMYNAFDFERDELDFKNLWPETDQSLAALDFYIGDPGSIGKGLGVESLKAFLNAHLFQQFDACLVDPDKRNKSAVKTYAKAGFCTVHEWDTGIAMIARKQEKTNPIIIFGSSRSDGHTLKAIKTVIQEIPIPIVDLRDLNIAQYDYTYANAKDDFIPLAEKMVRYNPIILATPVYWYSMSASLKTFIDRWSDLLDIRKDIGRRLAGKDLYVISSYGESIPRGFEDAFSQTCEYLDMQYRGCYYFYSGDHSELAQNNDPLAAQFLESIFHRQVAQVALHAGK